MPESREQKRIQWDAMKEAERDRILAMCSPHEAAIVGKFDQQTYDALIAGNLPIEKQVEVLGYVMTL